MRDEDKKTILVVEDNDLNLKLFQDLLEAHDFHVIDTKNGKEVEGMVHEHAPSLILMDIQLPECNGMDIIRKLKQNDELKHIPIIAVTAFAMKEDEEAILATGCEAYLAKPIKIDSFIETVNRLL